MDEVFDSSMVQLLRELLMWVSVADNQAIQPQDKIAPSVWSQALATNVQVQQCQLEKERKRLQEESRRANVCIVYMSRSREIVCIPCGHLTTCTSCAETALKECPSYRATIKKKIRAFSSQ